MPTKFQGMWLQYFGGMISIINDSNPNEWSLQNITSILKTLGYKEGLVKLSDDACAMKIAKTTLSICFKKVEIETGSGSETKSEVHVEEIDDSEDEQDDNGWMHYLLQEGVPMLITVEDGLRFKKNDKVGGTYRLKILIDVHTSDFHDNKDVKERNWIRALKSNMLNCEIIVRRLEELIQVQAFLCLLINKIRMKIQYFQGCIHTNDWIEWLLFKGSIWRDLVAVVIVELENKNSWSWFLTTLLDDIRRDKR
ncbi:hypothetical protein CR513_37944, partial [Mucuna pruriens]